MLNLDKQVQHLGYDPNELSEEEKIGLIEDSQMRLSKVTSIPDTSLTPSQSSSLSLCRAIAKIKVSAAEIPPASSRVRTAGMYCRSNKEIFISLEQLGKGREAVNTIIHEFAHHTSGAEDGKPEHDYEISNISERVVNLTKQGAFDNILGDPNFTW